MLVEKAFHDSSLFYLVDPFFQDHWRHLVYSLKDVQLGDPFYVCCAAIILTCKLGQDDCLFTRDISYTLDLSFEQLRETERKLYAHIYERMDPFFEAVPQQNDVSCDINTK